MPEVVRAHVRADKTKVSDEALIVAMDLRRRGATMKDAGNCTWPTESLASEAGINPTMLSYIERGIRLAVTSDEMWQVARSLTGQSTKRF